MAAINPVAYSSLIEAALERPQTLLQFERNLRGG